MSINLPPLQYPKSGLPAVLGFQGTYDLPPDILELIERLDDELADIHARTQRNVAAILADHRRRTPEAQAEDIEAEMKAADAAVMKIIQPVEDQLERLLARADASPRREPEWPASQANAVVASEIRSRLMRIEPLERLSRLLTLAGVKESRSTEVITACTGDPLQELLTPEQKEEVLEAWRKTWFPQETERAAILFQVLQAFGQWVSEVRMQIQSTPNDPQRGRRLMLHQEPPKAVA